MILTVHLQFKDAQRLTQVWAEQEGEIDFRTDPASAARTTCAFAAVELKRHLEVACDDLKCRFSEEPTNGPTISLEVESAVSRCDAFSLIPDGERLIVRGTGRTGLIHGVYEFLRLQGWRWYAPGPGGEIFRGESGFPVFPEERLDYRPAMGFARAFDFEYISMESAELALWMARNRMNVTTWRPNTGALCEKLGFIFKAGGHIFEKILDPDRPMPSGRTLWEDHPDWFGLPKNGHREKEKAQSVQFCVTADGLTDFLADELIGSLNGTYRHTDRLDVWGFDTWGSGCRCDACLSLGNSTDITLHLLSVFRRHLSNAYADGRLDREVGLILCAYEGTATLEPPSRPIPENLSGGNDSIVFYPIDRCYAHPLADENCPVNSRYCRCLTGWLETRGCPPLVLGEYYNVSKYEDLPLVFADSIRADIPAYIRAGVSGMTYMHLPTVNWGVRALNHLLYTRLTVDPGADIDALAEEYFTDLYGPSAVPMRGYYTDCEAAMAHIAAWRAWHGSLLSQLLAWDGDVPAQTLQPNPHFPSVQAMLKEADIALNRLKDAGTALSRSHELCRDAYEPIPPTGAVNPAEEKRAGRGSRHYYNVCEVLRGHRYAVDVWDLMYAAAAYHTALAQKKECDADNFWERAQDALFRLEKYYVPMSYDFPGAGLDSRAADERSQLAVVMARMRAKRPKRGWGKKV